MSGEIRASDLHRKRMKDDPAYRKAFAEQEDEFTRVAAAIDRTALSRKETKP